jgi:cytochrome c-type biogenesis protein CcmF
MGPVRSAMLVPYAFLSLGIMLGGWWSYAVLGWGGAWAWDPVENASFHPWLTGTAFLHSAMVLQRRGKLRDWTLVLGMSTFLLTLLGTFMTRSGVFNSVHSFTQSDIGKVFLIFIAIVLTYSVLLLAFRSHLLDEHAARVDGELGPRSIGRADTVISRDFAITVQNALFTVFTFTVLLGTLYPLIVEALQDRRLSVGEPYFNRWALPIGLGIVFMMGVGPALPWGRQAPEVAGRRLAPAAGVGVLLALLGAVGGYTKPGTILALFTIGFALYANLAEDVTPVLQRMRAHGEAFQVAVAKVYGRARRRVGGHVAHYGVMLAVFSLAMAKGYRVEQDHTMTQGQTVQFSGYDITYKGYEQLKQPHRTAEVATFEVARNGKSLGMFGPRMNHYPTQRDPIVTPEVMERPNFDLYFSLIDLGMQGNTVVVRLIYQPYQVWLWFSSPLIFLGIAMAIWPQRERQAATAAVPDAVPGGAK